MTNSELLNYSTQIRRDCLRMIHSAKSGHPGGSLGCADFFTIMYAEILNYDVKNFAINGNNEDVFFLSNGHISPVWYSTLARFGFFPISELSTFRKLESRLQGHPTPSFNLPGIRIASGSLGQGLSVALGMAQNKMLNNDNSVTFCLIGDGEIQEGQIWEAIMYGGAKNVKNIVAVIDYNNKQIDGDVSDVMALESIRDKWTSFHWNVMEMDGHNFDDMRKVLTEAKQQSSNKPVVIIMHTHMGQGVDFMLDNHKWHGTPPNDDEIKIALSQLKETLGDY
ncbi:MAG: transketolase [Lentimicrobiaceae bacterium]|nr:transketolase [Lentimicrobiaceae bacterium]